MAEKKESSSQNDFLVVGLGASAGGLGALKTFFQALPGDTGMAFVVIVHLSPEHESNMAELLQMQTSLKAVQVTEKVNLKPEHIYVIPPKKLLTVGDNHLELSEPEREHGLATIDLFFRSLAKAKEQQAVCIILSGTGSDGTVGLRAVKEAGGLTIVQTPEEAEYSGMPRSAIDSGLADLVLPVKEIAQKLVNYHKNLSQIQVSGDGDVDEKTLEKIFTRVQSHTGHDFSNYKRSSILRRIRRRMQVNRVQDMGEYHEVIQNHPDETDELFRDLLISVTNFFRDEEAFETLENTVIPRLFENKKPGEQLRVWVPGCATGEEAYSIAILLLEYVQDHNIGVDIKIFATDIDEAALNTARHGHYPKSISADVSGKRLKRHFERDGAEYMVVNELRDMILFAPHDLLRDPPFSNQDLIACRNLLIYLNRDLQSEVFNLFHYTLSETGYLFLGRSDSHLKATELFTPVDKKMRLYRRISSAQSNMRLPQAPLRFSKSHKLTAKYRKKRSRNKSNVEALHHNLLALLYAPQSVIINENYEVLHATDKIRRYLDYTGGEPSHDILEMIKPELRQTVRGLLFQVEKDSPGPLKQRAQLEGIDNSQQVEIIVHSIQKTDFSDSLVQIVFKEVDVAYTPPSKPDEIERKEPSEEDNDIIENLKDEIEYTKEQLQITVEQYETANEELRASNEELQSMNEELQSTTEELETSQEELQSVNEELTTVNQELENKITQLNQANSDLQNLMEAMEVGIIFVDNDFCIKRFTSASANIFNLISSDIGRPLHHVTHHLVYDGIPEDIKEVHSELTRIKKMVHTKDGRWYVMRIRPYRTTEDTIEGVVLSFVEFTELREVREIAEDQPKQEALAELGIYALDQQDLQAIMKRAIDLSCIILDLDCAVIYALDEQNGTLAIRAQAGCAVEMDPVEINEEWEIGYVFKHEDGLIVVDNYEQEERFSLSPFMEEEELVSSINVVVRGSDNTYGLLGFYAREQRQFTPMELQFVQVVANMVGMAVQNKYAHDELKKAVGRSKKYQREILNNSMMERWELGGYLHDNLGQMLASAKIMVNDIHTRLPVKKEGVTKEINQLNTILDQSIEDIRDLTHEIIPVDIEEDGVEYSFRFLLRQVKKMYDISCTLISHGLLKEITDRKLATHLYIIIQEAIKNAVTHGHADNITVTIKKSGENLVLEIMDDGLGIKEAAENSKGQGLRLIEYRTELHGGNFKINNNPDGNGTVVKCSIPFSYFKNQD